MRAAVISHSNDSIMTITPINYTAIIARFRVFRIFIMKFLLSCAGEIEGRSKPVRTWHHRSLAAIIGYVAMGLKIEDGYVKKKII